MRLRKKIENGLDGVYEIRWINQRNTRFKRKRKTTWIIKKRQKENGW